MVIDFHTHIFPDAIAERTVKALGESCNIPAHSDGKFGGLLERLAEAGVDIAVNQPVLTKPGQFDTVLDFATELNRREYTGERLISFAGIHPEEERVEQRLDQIVERGIKGIKLHPDYQGAFFDCDGYVHIIKEAKKRGLIVLTHAGVDGAFRSEEVKCTPERVLRTLDRVGGYEKLVLAHLGGNELLDEVYERLAGLDLYFDTAYILGSVGREEFLATVRKHGADRILFASDSPWQNIGDNLRRIRSFALSPEEEEKILYKNAKALLEI